MLGTATTGDCSVLITAQKSTSHLSKGWVCSWFGYLKTITGAEGLEIETNFTSWFMSMESQAAMVDKSSKVQT